MNDDFLRHTAIINITQVIMAKNTVILIHGYGDKGEAFQTWKEKLKARGYQVKVLGYTSLSDELKIKDIAEGLERALHLPNGLKPNEEFDVIVHSTGMLVIRAWLAAYPEQRHRIKHLIGLAPASFGSPVAHKAQSLVGKVMRGNREWGEDFLESGSQILDALELGSKFTWDLAHRDLLSSEPFYIDNGKPPYVFTFCGTSEYSGLKKFLRQAGAGTDGTVRLAGCSLNTRKIVIDLSKESPTQNQINVGAWQNASIVPIVPIAGLNHAAILKEPSDELIKMVDAALQVSSEYTTKDWYREYYQNQSRSEYEKIANWQQFIVRAVDERGDAIPDYAIEFLTKDNGELKPIVGLDLHTHAYTRDTSLRCFQLNVKPLEASLDNLWLRINATSGSRLVQYKGFVSSHRETIETWQGELDISQLLNNSENKFIYPLTTTLIELRLNREPSEQGIDANSKVCWFLSN